MRRVIAHKAVAAALLASFSFVFAGGLLAGSVVAESADKVYSQPALPVIPGLTISPSDPLQKVTARSAVVMDAVSGQILYERDMNARRFPASTTKIMTLIIALEKGNLDDIVTISGNAAGTEGSTLWLEKGDKIPLRELLTGMMMHSGNDATIAVAEYIAGSGPEVARMMTEKAHEIGAKDTNFINPNGLPNDNHYTTAHDLAVIASYGYRLPEFESIVSQQEASYDWVKDPTKKLRNENQMLWLYRGSNGVKTGYTEKAGRCLVSAAKRDGMQLVAVVLDSIYMWNDSIAMLDYGFPQAEPNVLVKGGSVVTKVDVTDARQGKLALEAADSLVAAHKAGSSVKIEKKIEVPAEVEAPIKKGDVIGKVVCYSDGEKKGSVDLIAAEDVERHTIWMTVQEWFQKLTKGIF